MYKSAIVLAILTIGLASCNSDGQVSISNQLTSDRIGEPIVLLRADIEKSIGKGGTDEVLALTDESGDFIPCQQDDLDSDGSWDELAFLVDIKASSHTILSLLWIPKDDTPNYKQLTQVYLAKLNEDGSFIEVQTAVAPYGLDGFPSQYQAEGVGWENDKMAFRSYFDCRNTKDLFGKLQPDLILQDAGKPGFGSYHNLADWGMDVLHCGSSLGAGGIAIIDNDSLYRLGLTENHRFVSICEGPVRSVFEQQYEGWKVGTIRLGATERITIWAGKYWFESAVKVQGFSGSKGLVTGLVTSKLDSEPIFFKADSKYSSILLHGKQSLNNDILAMAVLAPDNEIDRVAESSNVNFFQMGFQTVPAKGFSLPINETYYLSQNISSDQLSTHYVFAMWGLEDKKWNSLETVKAYISSEAQLFSNPLVIRIN